MREIRYVDVRQIRYADVREIRLGVNAAWMWAATATVGPVNCHAFSQERPMSPRTLRKRAVLAGCALLALSACGAPAVSSSEICGEARPLLALVANSGPEGYAAQVDKWRKVLDMAKDAEDPALAEFARLADERSRNAGNYYSPLN